MTTGLLSGSEEIDAILLWLRHTDDFPNTRILLATLTPENRRCYPVGSWASLALAEVFRWE